VFSETEHIAEEELAMAQAKPGYRRNWKKWLGIYVVVAAVVYLIVFLVFFHHGGGGGGIGY
jgi:hypothetical protein